MAWQDRFKQGTHGINPARGNASFRGVPFFLESSDAEFGKRIIEHEFPQSDTPFIEENGKKANRWMITGYVLGDDHLDMKDDIVTACTKSGSGVFMHPYFGKLAVQCKRVRVTNTNAVLRRTDLEMEFVEAGSVQLSFAKKDTVANILSKVEQAYLDLDEVFRETYIIAGKPYAKALQAQQVLGLAVIAMANAKKVVGRVAAFSSTVNTMFATVGTLFADAAGLSAGIKDLTAFGITDDSVLGDLVLDQKQAFKDLRTLFDFNPTRTVPSDPSGDPVDVMVQAVQVAGVIAAGGTIPSVTFDSVEDAVSSRQAILDKIDSLAVATSPVLHDTLFITLQELRTAVVEHIEATSLSLSRLTDYAVNSPMPSLVVANTLYGNLDQEAAIVARNKVSHPGFVGGGGKNLQVLLNA